MATAPSGRPRKEKHDPNIIRHAPRTKDFQPVTGNAGHTELIEAHIEKHIGPIAAVFHELVSDLVHIDLHFVKPTRERPWFTVVTSGMSDQPMQAPPDQAGCRYAELIMALPPDWPLGKDDRKDDRNFWPLRWLKTMARLPHEYDTWLWLHHTVPNQDPPQPLAANTRLCGFMLNLPLRVAPEFIKLPVAPDKTIIFFSLVPLYLEEMNFKLKRGAEQLLERLDSAGVTELLDIRRQNVCR